MSYKHDRDALSRELHQKLHDLGGGTGIKGACRFIRQEYAWPIDQGPGDRDSLLLSARELHGAVIHAIPQTYHLEAFARSRVEITYLPAGVTERQLHIGEGVLSA